jgi:hypothetical protein
VQNGLIPIAYRRDIRHGRILLGAFFFCLGRLHWLGQSQNAYVRMKDFDPYTNSAYTYSSSLSLIFTCTPASQHSGVKMPTVLVFLLYNTPTPGRGLTCVHACRNACT